MKAFDTSTAEREAIGARWRRSAWIVGLTIAASYVYFNGGTGWNQDARFDLTRAIVEHRRLDIDDYHTNTGDKSEYRGHMYSDKAPGVSLLAVPPYAWGQAVAKALGAPLYAPGTLRDLQHASTFFAMGLPMIGAALALMLIARRFGIGPGGATFAALLFALGTPMWAYGTALFGHIPATTSILVAFLFALGVADSDPTGSSRTGWRPFALGALLGWAIITEFTAAGAAAIIGLAALASARAGGRSVVRVALAIVAGALGPIATLAWYQTAAFGSPFAVPYKYQVGFDEMKQGFFGMSHPHFSAMAELVWGARRGLLWHAPALCLAPAGFALWWRRNPGDQASATSPSRWQIATCVAVFLYYFLLNASYHFWHGGCAYGPRFLSPGLPFLVLAVARIFDDRRLWLRITAYMLSAASFVVTAAAVATVPMTPETVEWPFFTLFWPTLRSGRVSIYFASFNLGELAGLSGLTSLLPLLTVYIAAAVAFVMVFRRSRTSPYAGLANKRHSLDNEGAA